MKQQKEKMRKANFKLPYTQSNKLEESTYKGSISNNVEPHSLNKGKPEVLKNLKHSSIVIGSFPH